MAAQLKGKNMSEHQPCLNVLNQLSGIFTCLAETKTAIVNDHIKSCVSSKKLDDPNQFCFVVGLLIEGSFAEDQEPEEAKKVSKDSSLDIQ